MLSSTHSVSARFDWPTALGRLVTRARTLPEKRCLCCGTVLDADLEFSVAHLRSFCGEACADEYADNG